MNRAGAALFCLAAAAVPGPAESAAPAAATVELSTSRPAQGEPVFVTAAFVPPAEEVAVVWKGVEVPAWRDAKGRHRAVVGADLLDPPGPARLDIVARREGEEQRVSLDLVVVEKAYPVQSLLVPREYAEFDPVTLARIEEEKKRMERILARVSSARPLIVPFSPPIPGFAPAGFGSRRLVNGEPRNVHAGGDAAAPEGTPVLAAEGGTVVFAGEQFFSGKSVVIDHGGGVFTVYFHLRDIAVGEGVSVSRAERIGSVGATGRATGPHLHFGVRVPGGRVDPAFFFRGPQGGGGG